jgi:hypothetical protein
MFQKISIIWKSLFLMTLYFIIYFKNFIFQEVALQPYSQIHKKYLDTIFQKYFFQQDNPQTIIRIKARKIVLFFFYNHKK